MDTKTCTIPPSPPAPPPTPCELQRIRQKLKAGIKPCPKPPPPPPPPKPAYCLGICREKIKNIPIPIKKHDDIKVCVVSREKTTQDRCDAILGVLAAKPDLPWPGCPTIPPRPPPPTPDPCQIIKKRNKVFECKDRMKRYHSCKH